MSVLQIILNSGWLY